MSKTTLTKFYAITAFIKPKTEGIVKYGGKSFKGIVSAKTPDDAKQVTIKMLAEMLKDMTKPTITAEHITIRECKLYNYFQLNCKY